MHDLTLENIVCAILVRKITFSMDMAVQVFLINHCSMAKNSDSTVILQLVTSE